MKTLLYIFLGGGIGSVCRYAVWMLVSRWVASPMPLGTLIVNLTGSLMIGLLWGSPFIAERDVYVKLLIVGFCGGFTTFSAFSWENLILLRNGDMFTMILYALASVIVCLLAVWGGYALSRAVM